MIIAQNNTSTPIRDNKSRLTPDPNDVKIKHGTKTLLDNLESVCMNSRFMIGLCFGYLAKNTPTQLIKAILDIAEKAFNAISTVEESIMIVVKLLLVVLSEST